MIAPRTACRVVLFSSLVMPTVGCQTESGLSGLDTERHHVLDWVSGSGSSLLSTEATAWRGMTATTAWELSVPLAWSDYLASLNERTFYGYHAGRADASHATFSRLTTGDLFMVGIDVSSAGPPLRARVAFVAMPD